MRCFVFLIAATLWSGSALAQTRPVIAVFNVEFKNLKFKKPSVDAMNEFLSAQVAASGVFETVPRGQLKAMLSEQKSRSYQQCIDEKCQIEIGKELAAQKSLSSQVLRLGQRCTTTLKLHDLKKSSTEDAVTVKGECTEAGIGESLEKAVAQLAVRLTGAKASSKVQVKLAGAVVGVGTDFQLYKRTPKGGWEGPIKNSCCTTAIAVSLDGRLLGVGVDLHVYIKKSKALDSPWLGPLKNSYRVRNITMDPQGRLMGVGTDLWVYRKKSTDLESPWVQLKNSCCVSEIAFDRRVMLGVGTQNQLWRKASSDPESAWVGPIERSCCVRSVMYDSDGRLLGLDMQNQLYKKRELSLKSAWEGPLKGSCCVWDISSMP